MVKKTYVTFALDWGRYILTFTAGGLHPFRNSATDISFVAIPRSTIDMTVSSFKSGKNGIVALF